MELKTKTVVVTIRPKDVRTSDYVNNQDCSLAKALKRNRQLKMRKVSVGGADFDFEYKNDSYHIQMEDCKIISHGNKDKELDLPTLIEENYRGKPCVIKFSFTINY